MDRRRRAVQGWVAAVVVASVAVATAERGGALRPASGQAGVIKSLELRDWLTYISSDELEGRAVFTTGFGLAAGYISEHLRAHAPRLPRAGVRCRAVR